MMTSSIEFGNEEILKQIVNAKVKQNYNWDELKAILVHKFKTVIFVYILSLNLPSF